MATYKVLQDIEAEDKLLGPLTLKQFGFAAAAAVLGYVSFLLVSKGAWFIAIPLLPFMVIFGFLAFPWGRDQSTEVWLLAKIRFYIKPRLRKWDQEGIEELVTITVPKKVENYELTKGFSKEEAKSRLSALADTIDSRGWAVKNVNVNLYANPIGTSATYSQDRLIDASTLALPQAVTDIHQSDDVLDENSQAAQHLTQLLKSSTENHREEVLEHMRSPQLATDGYDSSYPVISPPAQSSTTPTAAEQALLDKIHKENSMPKPSSHLLTINPDGSTNKPGSTSATNDDNSQQAISNSDASSGSTSVNPAILALADNDDLNISTIARQARKADEGSLDNEVVVSLR